MHKRFNAILAVLLMTVSTTAGLLRPTTAQAATVGLIKGSEDTVYWYSTNGKRYVFPNAATFRSWYGYWNQNIQQLSSWELGNIPLGGNVTYRPGVRLVKITTDPRVYAVSRYGVLRWVTNEAIASQLYGWNWAKQIDDVPDEFFVNYKIGAAITSVSDYNVSAERNAVPTPDQNIQIPYINDAIGSRFATYASKTTVNAGDQVTLNATLLAGLNYSPTITRMDIMDPRTAQPIVSCTASAGTCWITMNMNVVNGVTNIIFHARGYDAYNNIVADQSFPTITINALQTPTITAPVQAQTLTNNPRTVTVRWTNVGAERYVVRFSCDTCWPIAGVSAHDAYLTTNTSDPQITVTVTGDDWIHVSVQGLGPNETASLWSPAIDFRFNTNTPAIPATPTITTPYMNQLFTNYPRSMTVTWAYDGQPRHNIEWACDICGSTSQRWLYPTTASVDGYAMNYTPGPLPGDNQYRVRVQAVNAEGIAGIWSDYVYFNYKTMSYGYDGLN